MNDIGDTMETPDLAIDPRYPIGRFSAPHEPLTAAERASLIDRIAETPSRLREAVVGLTDEQLETPYRTGGWSIRQVVHHVADSHINSYTRFKLALTESLPTIKPYDEGAWATLPDVAGVPIEASLKLLEALHERWVYVLRAMSDDDWRRRLAHPESGEMSLDRMLALYAWHGRHHVAHITTLRATSGF